MAIQARELVGNATVGSHPSIEPHVVQPKKFIAATVLIKVGTPVARLDDNSGWVLWDAAGGAAGSALIKGIVFPEDIQPVAGGEVIGQVMLQGRIAYTSIVVPALETESVLKTALRDTAKTEGIIVSGLDGVK